MTSQPTLPPVEARSPGAGQLEVVAERGSVTLLPGTQYALNLTVRNAGGSPLTLELSAKGLPPNWFSLTPTLLELVAMQSAPVTLTLSPPPEAPPGSYPIALVVQSREEATVAVRLDLILEVGEPGGLAVEVLPPQAEGQAATQYQVQVAQNGATPLRVNLSASDEEGGCIYTFDPVTLVIPPAGAATSRLTVRPRQAFTTSDARTYTFSVTATALEGAAAASQAQGRFIQRRVPPVQIALAPPRQTGPAQVTYALRIANPSQIEATFNLTGSDPMSTCRYQFVPASVTVPPAGEAQATLTVTPLQYHTGLGDKIVNFTVRAQPVEEFLPPAQTEGQYVQTVMEPPELAITPSSQSASRSATYTLQVTNPHAIPIDVQLQPSDERGLCNFTVTPPRVEVPPNGQATARLVVRPTSKLLPGEARRSCPFKVEARVADLAEPAVVEASLTQVPGFRVPWGLVARGALLLLLIGLCGYLTWYIFISRPAPVGASRFTLFLCNSLGISCTPVPTPVAVSTPAHTPAPGATATLIPASACADFPPTRLAQGMKAYVSLTPLRNIVRSGPSRSSEELFRIDPGTNVEVIGQESQCNDGVRWWEIKVLSGEHADKTGWTGESDQGEYWLEPGEYVPTPAP